MNKERAVHAVLATLSVLVLGIPRLFGQTPPGTIMNDFNPGLGIEPGATISGVVTQGTSLLVFGSFTSFNGVPSSRIIRLRPDGSMDDTFNPGAGANGEIRAALVWTNATGVPGFIYVGGRFSEFNGLPRNRLARLKLNGQLETLFTPVESPDGEVAALAQVKLDILVGGNFSTVNGDPSPGLARYYPNGSRNWEFSRGVAYHSGLIANHILSVNTIHHSTAFSDPPTPYDHLLVGGPLGIDGRLCIFSTLGFLASTMPTMPRSTSLGSGEITSVLPVSTGEIFVGGRIASGNYRGLCPIRENEVHTGFPPISNLDSVSALAEDDHHRLWVAGTFRGTDGHLTNAIRRYFIDGERDRGFDANLVHAGTVTTLRPALGGGMMVAGSFRTLGGVSVPGIAKLSTEINPAAPAILRQPATAYAQLQGTAGLWVEAFAPEREPLYRWFKNGIVLPGRTNSVLAFGQIVTTDFADYEVEVSNQYGTVRSEIASIRPGSGPTILAQPSHQTLLAGSTVAIEVTAGGAPAPTVQWLKNDFALPGATNNPLVIPNSTTNDSGRYSCHLSNRFGSARTAQAFVAVYQPPRFLSFPPSQTVGRYSNVTFSAEVDSFPAAQLQWLFEGHPIPGASNGALTLLNVLETNSGAYTLWASNIAGIALSVPAVLTVAAFPPAIVWQSREVTTDEGSDSSLSVGVTGTPPFSYEWAFEGRLLPNTDSDHVNFFRADSTNSGTYIVTIRNEAGGVTSAPISLTVRTRPPEIFTHPVDFNGIAGQTALFRISADGAPPPRYQWYKDGDPLAGANEASLSVREIRGFDAGAYWATATNPYGSVTSQVATLTVTTPTNSGAINPDFRPELPAWVQKVGGFAVDRLGRILVSYGSAGGWTISVCRLNPDGSLDRSFTPPAPNGSVLCFDVQADDKIILGGEFNQLGTLPYARLARLNDDGTLDQTFAPPSFPSQPAGPSLSVADILILDNGDIVHTGATYYWGKVRSSGQRDMNSGVLALSPPGGTHDPSPTGGYALAADPLGRMLLPGDTFLWRVTPFGVVDPSFSPFAGSASPVSLKCVATLPDGRIIAGGGFTNSLVRLNSDGRVDPTFSSPFTNGWNRFWRVRSIAPLPDGRILVAGDFRYILDGRTNYNIARLQPNGELDETFDPLGGLRWGNGSSAHGYHVAVRPDGQVLVAGEFESCAGVPRPGLALLRGDSPTPPRFLQPPNDLSAPHGRIGSLAVNVSYPPTATLQWFHNERTLEGATNQSLILRSIDESKTGTYFVVARNAFGVATSAVSTVTVTSAPSTPGSLRVGTDFHRGTDAPVRSSALLVDGRILIGGNFSTVHGVPRRGLAALRPDGTVDPDFQVGSMQLGPMPPSGREGINGIVADSNGFIYVIGTFSELGGVPRSGVARLKPNGEIDPDFVADANIGLNVEINAVAVTPDDRVILAGNGLVINGRALGGWGALNRTGGVDVSYTVLDSEPTVRNVALGSDGLALVTSPSQIWFARTYGPKSLVYSPALAEFTTVPEFVTPLAGGGFGVAGVRSGSPSSKKTLLVLKPSGPADPLFGNLHFVESATGPTVSGMARDACGLLVIAGKFTKVNGTARYGVARLLPDGQLDPSFNAGRDLNGPILTLQILPDDGVLIGGMFDLMDGSFRPGLAILHGDPMAVPEIVGQPRGAHGVTGFPLDLTVETTCGASFRYQWFRDGRPLPGESNATLSRRSAITSLSGDYTVVVSNPAGAVTSSVARVTVEPPVVKPGHPDWEFHAGSGPDAPIRTLIVDAQNRLIVGGLFTNFDGRPLPLLARLDPSGRLDPTFAPLAHALAPGFSERWEVQDCQWDARGQLYVAGRFRLSSSLRHLVRIQDDGRVDPTFQLGNTSSGDWTEGVSRILPMPDGSIIASGAQSGTARLLPDGRWAPFIPSSGAPAAYRFDALALGSEGGWYAGGTFAFQGTNPLSRMNLARFNRNGALDPSFDAGYINGAVRDISTTPDGGLVVSGTFSEIAGWTRPGIARLFPDGRLDPAFLPVWPWSTSTVLSARPLTGGKVLLAGAFASPNGSWFPIARIGADGLLDPEFDPLPLYPYANIDLLTVSRWGTIYGSGPFPLGLRPSLLRFHGDPVLVIRQTVAHQAQLEAVTVTGLTYHLEALDQLGATNWQPVAQWPGNGSVQVFPATEEAPTGPSRYYRLRRDTGMPGNELRDFDMEKGSAH